MENRQNRYFEVTNDLLASQGQRFVHYIIDNVVIYLILIIIIFFSSFICGLLDSSGFVNWLGSLSDLGIYGIYYSFMILYYTVFEFYFSKTVAKFITNTIVVMEDGSKPTLETIFKRTLCRIIPFDPFSYLGSNARGWHDSIMDVYIVKKKDFEYKRDLFYSFNDIGKPQEEN